MEQLSPTRRTAFFECGCSDLHHIARLSYWSDDISIAYLEVRLCSVLPRWWDRLRTGLLYIIGHDSVLPEVDELVLDRETATKLRDALSDYLSAVQEPSESDISKGRRRIREAAAALIDYVKNKYPGEELRCPHMRTLDEALTSFAELQRGGR